jgi:hypothetical protein
MIFVSKVIIFSFRTQNAATCCSPIYLDIPPPRSPLLSRSSSPVHKHTHCTLTAAYTLYGGARESRQWESGLETTGGTIDHCLAGLLGACPPPPPTHPQDLWTSLSRARGLQWNNSHSLSSSSSIPSVLPHHHPAYHLVSLSFHFSSVLL